MDFARPQFQRVALTRPRACTVQLWCGERNCHPTLQKRGWQESIDRLDIRAESRLGSRAHCGLSLIDRVSCYPFRQHILSTYPFPCALDAARAARSGLTRHLRCRAGGDHANTPVSTLHCWSHPRSRSPPSFGGASTACHARYAPPSAPRSSTPSIALERRSASSACCGVCTIGPATLSEVFTDTSTPTRLPIALR